MNFNTILTLVLMNTAVILANTQLGSQKQSESSTKVIESLVYVNIKQWDQLCSHIIQMMQKNDMRRKNKLDVMIYFLGPTKMHLSYEEFVQTLQKYENFKNSFLIYGLSNSSSHVHMRNSYKDFLIVLLDEKSSGYSNFINSIFKRIFIDKTVKMFVLLSYDYNYKNALKVWNALWRNKYYNVYILMHNSSGSFNIFRTAMKNVGNNEIQLYLRKADELSFLTMKDILKGDEIPFIRVIFFDTHPISYVKNGSIIGADGNLIQEFSNKHLTSYKVVNDHRMEPTVKKILNDMEIMGDIDLYTYADVYSPNIQTIRLNQMHGVCLLTPRNIHEQAYGSFKFLIDFPSIIMVFLSALSVIMCWKLITNEMSLTSILISTYEIMLNLDTSCINRLTFRENILVYCSVFASFFLALSLQSRFIAFVFNEPIWRSARNIEELNASSTKFYSFFTDKFLEINNLPRIRQDLVMSHINILNTISLDVPEKFDENLVYIVYCEYADYFIQSSRNYRNGRQIFDKLVLTQSYKTYNVKSGYYHIEEFKVMVQKLMESGIYGFWKKLDLENTVGSVVRDHQDKHSDFEDTDLIVPISILFVGILIATLALLIEMALNKWKIDYFQRFNRLRSNCASKKKLKLDKWKQKFIFKKTSNLDGFLKGPKKQFLFNSSIFCEKDHIRSCEAVKGSYIAIKMYNLRVKKLNGFLNVKPYYVNITKV